MLLLHKLRFSYHIKDLRRQNYKLILVRVDNLTLGWSWKMWNSVGLILFNLPSWYVKCEMFLKFLKFQYDLLSVSRYNFQGSNLVLNSCIYISIYLYIYIYTYIHIYIYIYIQLWCNIIRFGYIINIQIFF